jgi:beta-1,4-mannosyl-glycoprotein beta-1,4-N-acetylglucosaminyltransferase
MKVKELRHLGHKVVDVFPFFNEFELLELRLNILSPYVDLFVLVECPQTFAGNEKPLYFSENKDFFDKWKDKILVHVVSDQLSSKRDIAKRLSNLELPNLDRWILEEVASSPLPRRAFQWKREFYQRESAHKALPEMTDNDLVFCSDIDEIWNPEMTFDWDEDVIFKLEQTVFQYRMNNRSNEKWSSAFFTAAKNIQHTSLNMIRASKVGENIVKVAFGGWHFTYQGGEDRIRYKIESYGHQEYNKRRLKSQIGRRLSLNRDLFNRNLQFSKDESILPAEVLAMKARLPNWFL